MSYPQSIEYNDAVQDPRTFTDPELKRGAVATTPLGLPLALSGGFALTYTVQVGAKKLAVRCFHKEVPDAQDRYAKISTKLRSLASNYFVNFDFQPNGIRIKSATYPIVKMEWAEGQTLGVYLDRTSSNASALNKLRQSFSTLATYLESQGVAHGDIQNENVIVDNGAVKLIDYDGMFVAGLPEGRGTEVGHKHFQHPLRDTKLFGPKMDRFSFIVIDVSLEAMQANSSLHARFREGGNAIIFNANDFASPSTSEVFGLLRAMPALRSSVDRLAAICQAPASSVPTLEDFRAGRNIPAAAAAPTSTRPAAVVPAHYIGAFPVFDGEDFNAVLRQVGNKVELVGQIVSVMEGVGKRGRGKGLPYVFINFGPWNKESVKVTIWSEGLGNIAQKPSKSWAGKWISVTGLIEPPYNGQHYGRPYKNVGITVVSGNQIIQLTEKDAKFRLTKGVPLRRSATPTPTATRPKNADILDDIRGGTRTGTTTTRTAPRTTTPVSPPPTTTTTKNAQILKTIKSQTQPAPGVATRPSPPPHQYKPPPAHSTDSGLLSKIPGWLWIIIGLIALRILASLGK